MMMSAIAEPVTASILFRQQRAQIDLLVEAAQGLAGTHDMSEETQSLLEQIVRICLHAPSMVRDLWEWGLEQAKAGRIQNRPLAGKALRDELSNWLDLLGMIYQSAGASAAAGYPIPGAEELLTAEDELAAIAKEVNQAWPIEELPPPAASIGLSYQELRRLADHPPVEGDWPEEDFDRV